jgi:hypothetical protein
LTALRNSTIAAAIAGVLLVLLAYYAIPWGDTASNWTAARWYQEAIPRFEGARFPLAFQSLGVIPLEVGIALLLLATIVLAGNAPYFIRTLLSLIVEIILLKLVVDVFLFNAIAGPRGGYIPALIGALVAANSATAGLVLHLAAENPHKPMAA